MFKGGYIGFRVQGYVIWGLSSFQNVAYFVGQSTPWDLAWTFDNQPFGTPLYCYDRYLRVNP